MVLTNDSSCTRYYNPGTGRFLSEDPIGINKRNHNLYKYVGNNPLRYTDPLGLVGVDQECLKKLKQKQFDELVLAQQRLRQANAAIEKANQDIFQAQC